VIFDETECILTRGTRAIKRPLEPLLASKFEVGVDRLGWLGTWKEERDQVTRPAHFEYSSMVWENNKFLVCVCALCYV